MANYKQEQNNANLGLITIAIVIATVFMCFGLFVGLQVGKNEKQNKAYQSGYNRAKLTYECDHDNTECEILKEEI